MAKFEKVMNLIIYSIEMMMTSLSSLKIIFFRRPFQLSV